MNKKIKFLIFTVIFISLSKSVFADPSPWTTEPTYFRRSTAKLGYGASNFVRGWGEPYIHMIKAHEDGNNSLTALIRGGLYGLGDIAGGMFHGFTFFLPIDLPLPEGGAHGFSSAPSYS